MPITVKGLDRMKKNFKKFRITGPQSATRFLDLVSTESLILIRANTPVDTGELQASWREMGRGADHVDIGTPLSDLVELLTTGTRYIPPNPFVFFVDATINGLIMDRLEGAMAEKHEYFRSPGIAAVGGRQRARQQVGRTSAGFSGGTTFAGRASIQRPGMGRRRLRRVLRLPRRKGKSVNQSRKEIRIG